jgi:hypothetical protein
MVIFVNSRDLWPKGRNAREWRTFWHRAFPYLTDEAIEYLCDGFRKVDLPV